MAVKVVFYGENMFPELRTEDNVHGQMVNTVTCTVKVKIPDTLAHRLDSLFAIAQTGVERMLADRAKSSSKYYPELPCVIAKSLIRKYQRNRRLRTVSRLVLPICGDKERQIKWDGSAIRIPAIFEKEAIPVTLPRPPIADEQERVNLSGEFFRREGDWYLSLSYKTAAVPALQPTGMVGVDRNSVGAVATMADPETGKVFHLGFNPGPTKLAWRNRRRNLQKQGKKRLLARIRRKQSRRTRYENHRVSKAIVDYARAHRRAVVLEDLGELRSKRSKARSYTERSQWSFYQLCQFILYKAALSGVMVFEVTAAYSSQECSRCHALTKPAGKKFVCLRCGHKDHKDANAAFALAERVMPTCGLARESESPALGPIGGPLSANGITGVHSVSIKNRLSEYLREVLRRAVSVTDQTSWQNSSRQGKPDERGLPSGLMALSRRGQVTLGAPNEPALYPNLSRLLKGHRAAVLLDEERGSR